MGVTMKKKHMPMYLMLVPAIILFVTFIIVPFILGIQVSFYKWNGYSQHRTFIGMQNYYNLLSDTTFKRALLNTLYFGIGSTIIQNVLGLAYAVLVNKDFKLKNFVRVFVYLPSIISGLVMGYMMYNLFQYSSGALNDIMLLFGREKVDWLGDANTARAIILLVNSVQFVGISMVIYLAGLQNIPKSLIEASSLDGATDRQIFRHVTLPLLVPAIRSSIILNLVGGLQLYGVILALTNGGPGGATNSVATLINMRYFNNENAGGAAAVGLTLFIVIFTISYITNRYFNDKEVEL